MPSGETRKGGTKRSGTATPGPGSTERNLTQELVDRLPIDASDPNVLATLAPGVVAVGDDAIDGGIFKGSYTVLDGAHAVVPVHYRIPGDPPSPETILRSLLEILNDLDGKRP